MKDAKKIVTTRWSLGAFTSLRNRGQVFFEKTIPEIKEQIREEIEEPLKLITVGSEMFLKHNHDPVADAISNRAW